MPLKLENFLPYRLSRLSEAVSNEIRSVYKEMYDLNRPEWRVLAALAEIGPATAKEISLHSAQHKTKVSRAVYALEQRRWLLRETDPSDRRAEFLALTKAGHRAYHSLTEPLLDRETQILERLDQAERKKLLEVLSSLEKVLGLK